MHSWLIAVAPLSVLVLGMAVVSPPKKTAPPPSVKIAPLDQATWPYFEKNCTACHDAETRAGALDMAFLRRADSVTRSRETWESIVRKIRTGEMPPKDSPRPNATDTKTVLRRIESEFDRVDRATPPNPGRVTARRLNRTEYNNTVRDLVGITFRPADDFAQDDSGYGFDNIGDVLSLSPSQMEKYVTASEKIARAAVFGPEALQPTLTRHEEPGQKLVTGTIIPAQYDVTGLTLPNARHTMHRFPISGEYVFRFGMNGVRPLGSEAIHLRLWLDGRPVQSLDFDPTGQAAFNPDRQDFSGRTQECKFRVTAGDHWVDATISNLFEGLPLSYGGLNPSKRQIAPAVFKARPGLTPEEIEERRKRFEERQKERAPTNDVRISFLEIGGPYAQEKGPSEESLHKIFVCGHLHGGHTPACTEKSFPTCWAKRFGVPPRQMRSPGLVVWWIWPKNKVIPMRKVFALRFREYWFRRISCFASSATRRPAAPLSALRTPSASTNWLRACRTFCGARCPTTS